MGINVDEALKLEERRWEAILSADVETLDDLLSDRMRYVHASGKRDTKESYLATIASGRVRYRTSERTNVEVSVLETAVVVIGEVAVGAAVDGKLVSSDMRYTAAWALEAGHWRFVSWHSTSSFQEAS